MDNPDLATGFDRVTILALKGAPEIPSMSVVSLNETVKTLQHHGVLVELYNPMKPRWRPSPHLVAF
jgi:hypothetical protein